jgi:WD40 repeat protein
MRFLAIGLVLLGDVNPPAPAFNPARVALVRAFEEDGGRACVATVSPDGRTLAIAGKAEIHFLSLATGETLRTLPLQCAIDQIRFSGDGRHLLLLSTVESVVRVLQLPEGTEACTIKDVDPQAHTLSSSSDGKFLAVGSKSGCRIHEIPSGRETRTLQGTCPAFAREGKRIATIDEGGRWSVSNALSGLPGPFSSEKIAGTCSLGFSPDGRRIASANNWGEIRIWDANNGKGKRVFTHPGFIVLLDWSRDGRWIASGANDGIVRIWDATEGREVRRLEAHNGMINSIIFPPDGRSLVTAGADGKAKLWGMKSLMPEALVESPVGAPGTGMIGLTGADGPDGGVTITSIIPGSAAERYGLQVNDVLTEFKGAAMTSYAQLANEVIKHGEGEIVKVKIKRAGKEVELTLKLGRR